MTPPRIDPQQGRAALADWARRPDGSAPRSILATAVRHTLQQFAEEHPGGAVELRVPPFGAVQAIAGTRHTRGTPPAVVETDAATWLRVVTGAEGFAAARADGRISASGERSDLGPLLPLPRVRRAAAEARHDRDDAEANTGTSRDEEDREEHDDH